MHPAVPAAAALALALGSVATLSAQSSAPAGAPRDSAAPSRGVRAVAAASAAEDRWRAAQLLGLAPAEGFMVRSLSSAVVREGAPFAVVAESRAVYNSRIPFSLNDGALWAGRGAGARVRAGFAARTGPLLVVLAPEVVVEQNRQFDALLPAAWDSAQRASFLPPWQTGRNAVDLPYRFGRGEVRRVEPGQSTLALVAGKVMAGASSESQWWGPGVRNALVLSDNAAGVPHLFLATAAPVRTPLGVLEGRWMIGGLSASAYDTAAAGPGRRSFSAAALALSPGGGLTVGAARAVYAPVESWGGVAGHAADVLTRRGATGDTTRAAETEQVMSLFARYVIPSAGLEVYGEWGRNQLPSSLRDLLVAPEHSQGYTLGAGWAGRAGSGTVALRGELTYLERSSTFRVRPEGSWYASSSIPQGYTQRGQVLGAAIGPGASSQWLGADWLGGRARAGLFLGRVRWADDAYMDTPDSKLRRYRGHEVTIFGGARAGTTLGGFELTGEWTVGRRYNYLFQNFSTSWETRDQAVNVTNHTLGFEIRPLRHAPAPR